MKPEKRRARAKRKAKAMRLQRKGVPYHQSKHSDIYSVWVTKNER